MAPLPEEQADEVREIVSQEIDRFAGLLRREMNRGNTIRADGNIPGAVMIDCVDEALGDYLKGERP